jgi:hypothetical protein
MLAYHRFDMEARLTNRRIALRRAITVGVLMILCLAAGLAAYNLLWFAFAPLGGL